MRLPLKILALFIVQANLIAASDPDRFIYRLVADTFIHAGQPDTPESELRGDEKCAVPCELSTSSTLGEPQLSGPCGCIGPEGNCNEEFNQKIVKELCNKMGNITVTAHSQTDLQVGIKQHSEEAKLPAKQRSLQFKAGAECWQETSINQGICNVIFAADTQPLLKWLIKARSKNIKFSHCSLSFGDEPPLKSTVCFTPNETLGDGEPRVVLAHLRALEPADQTPKLRFTASFDDNREFVTQELVFDTRFDMATAPQTT